MQRIKTFFKRFFGGCFNGWWKPSFVTLVIYLIPMAVDATDPDYSRRIAVNNIFAIFLRVSFLGILAAAIYNLFKKRWAKGVINLVVLLFAVSILIGFRMVLRYKAGKGNAGWCCSQV